MRNFLEKISPKNKNSFLEFKRERLGCYLRQHVHENIISRKSESDYICLDIFVSKLNSNTGMSVEISDVSDIIPKICKELQDLGWKTALSFGNTGLFIYENERPNNCF